MRDVTVEVLIRRNTELRLQRDAAVRDNQRLREVRFTKAYNTPRYFGGTLRDNVTQSRNARDAHDFF